MTPRRPCAYCCAPIPCGAEPEDHDDNACEACLNVPMDNPHPECLEMVAEYEEQNREGAV